MIYLDSAAMEKPLPVALEAYHNAPFGNPSSEHLAGMEARTALENARHSISKLLDCEPEEITFTSTATEAAALIMYSLSKAKATADNSPYEHHAISENILPPECETFPDVYFAQMHSNNETGEVFEVGRYQYDGCVCDATASVGHIPVSFKNLGVDYLIADAIKFGGVPGAAFLIAKQGDPLSPLIRGGGQERGMRSGTENVPAICAMAAALEWQVEHMKENIQKIAALRSMLFYSLSEIPDHQWNTPFNKPCLPHILNISFKGVDAHALTLALSSEGVMISPGAACSNGLNEPSHVIMAMYNDEARARSAVRLSISHETTADEIAEASQKIKDAVAKLRELS